MGPTLETGSVFARSFSTLGTRFGPLFGSVLVLYLPVLVATMVMYSAALEQWFSVSVFLLAVLSFLLLSPLASAAVVRGVYRHLRGRSVDFDDCWRGLGSNAFRVIGLSLLVGLATGLSFLLCIIPGFIVQAGLFVAIPILVVEGRGVGESYNRSWSLTEGHRLRIFFIVIGLGLLSLGVSAFIGYGLLVAGLPPVATDVASQLLQSVFTALQAVVAGVVYFDLREIREGLGLDDLAAVFD